MAYDEELANRVRELVMAVAVSGQGGLMVRVDRDDTEAK
jgi:hypothetical protein